MNFLPIDFHKFPFLHEIETIPEGSVAFSVSSGMDARMFIGLQKFFGQKNFKIGTKVRELTLKDTSGFYACAQKLQQNVNALLNLTTKFQYDYHNRPIGYILYGKFLNDNFFLHTLETIKYNAEIHRMTYNYSLPDATKLMCDTVGIKMLPRTTSNGEMVVQSLTERDKFFLLKGKS